jgi:hypothetical protein
VYLGVAEVVAGGNGDAALPPVALWVARQVSIDPQALHAALRRAQLVLAAGGDPHRDLSPDDVAVARLAEELDSPTARLEVERELARLEEAAAALRAVSGAVAILRADRDRAWRWVALALLADELVEEDRPSG